jgi:xanthine dehydrogenase accessory factor
MDLGVLARAVDLWEQREPFALATVVWRRAPSSGHLGSKAVIRQDGSIDGWLGGACAQPTVVHEAMAALSDGRSRLLLLGQPDDLSDRPDDGILKVPMACESEGAMEIYLEPMLPPPQIVVIGRSPAVFMLARLAVDLEWDVVVVDDDGDPADHPHPDLVRTHLDLDALALGPASAVVVATQGSYDDLALDAALATGAGYIGLVAASKRAATTIELLRERGASGEQLARIDAPAGLDLGRVENAEIAVAVLADLVARRAAGSWSGPVTSPPRAVAVDPVCGMMVEIEGAKYRATHADVEHRFCSPGCQAAFVADPDRYATH